MTGDNDFAKNFNSLPHTEVDRIWPKSFELKICISTHYLTQR